mmetsp:Transcript_17452/g.27887  ORF Transcript_17452/g.27887 Transcript_17452/m.27887 type:complete len:274 (-) Transcript_17452:7-828(-)
MSPRIFVFNPVGAGVGPSVPIFLLNAVVLAAGASSASWNQNSPPRTSNFSILPQPPNSVLAKEAPFDVRSRIHSKYTCYQCFLPFRSEILLKEHVRSVHEPHQCIMCRSRFRSVGALKVHIQKHKKEILSKRISMSGMEKRARVMGGPFACPFCQKGFANKMKLVHGHLARHLDLRKFFCDVCGKSYTQKASLPGHRKTHMGWRFQKCPNCGETARLKNLSIADSRQSKLRCSWCIKKLRIITDKNLEDLKDLKKMNAKPNRGFPHYMPEYNK